MNNNIELREYIKIFKKRFVLIVIITLAPAIFMGLKPNKTIESYQTQSTFIIKANTYVPPVTNTQEDDNKDGEKKEKNTPAPTKMSQQDISYVQSAVETFAPIFKTAKLGEALKEKINTDLSPEVLIGSVNMSLVSGPIMTMTATSDNPELAQKLANTAPEVFVEELKNYANVSGVEFIQEAKLPGMFSADVNPIGRIIKGGIVGAVLAIFVVFLLEFLDNKIATPSDVEDILGVPVIGSISKDKKLKKDKNKSKKE